jgi:hypothetical protein
MGSQKHSVESGRCFVPSDSDHISGVICLDGPCSIWLLPDRDLGFHESMTFPDLKWFLLLYALYFLFGYKLQQWVKWTTGWPALRVSDSKKKKCWFCWSRGVVLVCGLLRSGGPPTGQMGRERAPRPYVHSNHWRATRPVFTGFRISESGQRRVVPTRVCFRRCSSNYIFF